MKNNLDELMPLLVGLYRKMTKETGPLDRLQTREFRTLVQELKKNHQGHFNPEETNSLAAYLLYDYVVHYQEGLSLIEEVPFTPKSVLDVASGALPFSLAALERGAKNVTAIDKSMRALETGAEIVGRMGFPVSIRKWVYPQPIPVEGKFDLIILGHALFELAPENPDKLIDLLLSRLTKTGQLLLVDSSLPEWNRKILELRDRFVEKGIAIQAPCVWRGECVALKSKAPCYAQREFEKPHIIKEIQRASQINLSSLKMTYLILRSPESEWPEPKTTPCWRVISPPVDTFSSKMFYLCGTDGKKTLSSHLQEHPKQSRAFEYLKRGELITVSDALETNTSLSIVENTTVRVEAPLNKPLPVETEEYPSF